jgi:hypothetical protein
MADDDIKIERFLACETHGHRRWQGHLMCYACGLIFQTKDPKAARFPKETCACGVRLMPHAPIGDALGVASGQHLFWVSRDDSEIPKATETDGDFSARPICYLCSRRVLKHHNGRVPMPPRN